MIELPKEDNPLCSCKLPVFDVAADGPHMTCRPQDLTTGADDSTIHTVMPFMEEFNPDGHPMRCHVCNHMMHNTTIDDYFQMIIAVSAVCPPTWTQYAWSASHNTTMRSTVVQWCCLAVMTTGKQCVCIAWLQLAQ